MGAVRFDAKKKKWTRHKAGGDGKKNSSHLIYGMPIYAVADGEVVRCWRNAPDNPAPGKKHPGRTSTPKRIYGGGNFLLVKEKDGRKTLYAHFIPGTVPKSLCPINKVFAKDASDRSECTLPSANRPKVKRGQFLGRVGNSGRSSGPHLHIHRVTAGGKAASLRFDRVFVKGIDKLRDNVSDWSARKNAPLPPGKVAILPNYGKGSREIARHGVPSSKYQFTFSHIAGSGYRLEWIDGFRTNGKTYFNAVFRAADSKPWKAFHNLTGTMYQDAFNKHAKERLPTGAGGKLSSRKIDPLRRDL